MRAGEGEYQATSSALFTAEKTCITATLGSTAQTDQDANIRYALGTTSLITFYTEKAGDLADSVMVDTTITIEVYR